MENVCHYLPGDMRSIMKKVTNGDIGGGGGGGGGGGADGGQRGHFCGDIIFEWPLDIH